MTRTTLDRMTTDLENRAAWVKTYPAGRRCRTCDGILSVYNETDYCHAHQPEPDEIWCGYRVLTCRACGETVCVTGDNVSRSCGACGAER